MKSLREAWVLRTEKGRQRWFFDRQKAASLANTTDENELLKKLDEAFVFDSKKNPNAADTIHRKQFAQHTNPETDALKKGLHYFLSLQQKDGNWSGDYGGPLFLLPGLVIVSYACGEMPSVEKQVLMRRYILNHQNDDGGWGLHIEDRSTMFGTVLNVVSLALLGLSVEDERIGKSFAWVEKNGGASSIPPWGKMYLALLGLYDWKGLDALLPEMWTFPKWLPIFPGNYWNHARMVYLPMSYLSGTQFKCKEDDLLKNIKKKLYPKGFEQENWKKARRTCCPIDDYYPETKFYRFLAPILNSYNTIHLKFWRKKALQNIGERIRMEDFHTHHINLGPVNKVLNALVIYTLEGKSENFKRHIERFDDYLWVSEDGMKMNGYNGSQFWDTVFFSQALLENSQYPEEVTLALQKIEHYLDISIIRQNEKEYKRFNRSASVGGWPFSTIEHGWPITDCTSEGIKTIVQLEARGLLKNKTLFREIEKSVNLIISYQNRDGGWASYEKTRGSKWLELLNPSRIFGEIMIDYSYVECTSACLQGIYSYYHFQNKEIPPHIAKIIQKGTTFIQSKQKENGLWYGLWAVCFTYATWFATEALSKCEGIRFERNNLNNPLTKSCNALIHHQKEDGSWGESYESCVKKEYIQHAEGQVVNTAWAILSLMAAHYDEFSPIERGITFLKEKQLHSGDWPQQGISGVFNHNCMITYINYRNIFPLWALQRYENYLNTFTLP